MKKRKNRQRIIFGILAVVLAVIMVGSLAVAMVRADEPAESETLEAVTITQTEKAMQKNAVYIDNIDVTNMTSAQAEEAVREHLKQLQEDIIVLYAGDRSVRTTAGDLGLDYTNKEIVEEALSIGKKGNVLKRFLAGKQITEDGPITLELDLSVDEKQVKKVISTRKSALNCEPVPNSLEMNENGTFSILAAKEGVQLNEAGSVEAVIRYMEEDWHGGQGGVELDASILPSADTAEQLQDVRNVLGTASSEYSLEDTARETNITLATRNINGMVLYPGEEFSTVQAIGPTTQEYGFALGASYAGDEIIDTYGGGVCQVSSTLYDAVLEAELEVTERHNHTMRIHYVPPAFDATISDDVLDFRFVNSTDTPIYIEGVAADGTVSFTIYGKEIRNTARTIEYESRILDEKDFDTVYKTSDSLTFGIVQEFAGEKGVEAQLWKMIYIDGELDSEELVNTSYYSPTSHLYRVGLAGASSGTRSALTNAVGARSMDLINAAIRNGSLAEDD